jgi:hypothetical protein
MKILTLGVLCAFCAIAGAGGAFYALQSSGVVETVAVPSDTIHIACAEKYAPDANMVEQCRTAAALRSRGAAERERVVQEYKAAKGL